MDQPNQISYHNVCEITGKLFIESRYEMERLTAMLLELQKKYSQEQQERLKVESALTEAQHRIAFLEGQLNGTGKP